MQKTYEPPKSEVVERLKAHWITQQRLNQPELYCDRDQGQGQEQPEPEPEIIEPVSRGVKAFWWALALISGVGSWYLGWLAFQVFLGVNG